MKRVISLYLPTLPTDRMRRWMGNNAPSPHKPFILIGKNGADWIATAADALAQRLGITAGMDAVQARALVPELHIEHADPARDALAIEGLAQWALKHYSPIIATDSDGLMIDASDAANLFGSEEEMLENLQSRLLTNGYAARLAIAPTYGAAHALARLGVNAMTIIGDDFRLPLLKFPVNALRIAPQSVRSLAALGFETIGDLEQTDKAFLLQCFDREIVQRLDQACGRETEFFTPVSIPEPIIIRRHFEEPVCSYDVLACHISKLVNGVCATLEAKHLGARTLDLFFHRLDHRLEAIRVNLPQPSLDAHYINHLLGEKLETITAGSGIEMMSVSVICAESVNSKNKATGCQSSRTDLASLVAALSHRVGPGQLYQARPVASDTSEHSFVRVEPLAALKSGLPVAMRLFRKSEPVQAIALLPDVAPIRVNWSGAHHKVACAEGSQRIFGQWWQKGREPDASRDYFQLEDGQGEGFWLFAKDNTEITDNSLWYVHGLQSAISVTLFGVLNIVAVKLIQAANLILG